MTPMAAAERVFSDVMPAMDALRRHRLAAEMSTPLLFWPDLPVPSFERAWQIVDGMTDEGVRECLRAGEDVHG